MATTRVLGPNGRPVKHSDLTREVAEASIGSVRSPIFGYPADGLDPLVLASILRAADHGDPIRYMGLAETIEERDPHYLAVLGNRKRAVSQLQITVQPGGEEQAALDQAEALENWLQRDELTFEIVNILDAIGKGYSLTEIIWDFSEGQYEPNRLEWRDQRWFRFDRKDRHPVHPHDSRCRDAHTLKPARCRLGPHFGYHRRRSRCCDLSGQLGLGRRWLTRSACDCR